MCCAAGNFSRYGHKRCQIQWPQPEKVDQKCVTGQTLISGLNIMSVKLLTACRCSSRRIHISTFNLFAPRMDLKV